MAQRLVIINNIPDGADWKYSSAVYYRWGAYTRVALDEVAKLSDSVEKEFYQPDISKLQPTDRFNMACLNAASGMTSDLEESIDYIENLTDSHYDTSNANGGEGIIAFSYVDIQNLIGAAEYVLEIFWRFDEYGQPDISKTTFNITELVNYYEYEDKLSEYAGMSNDDIKHIKQTVYQWNTVNVPITNAKRLSDEIPNEWYDPSEDCFCTTVY